MPLLEQPDSIISGTKTSNNPYIITVIIGAVVSIIGVVLVSVLRINQDNTTIIVAIFGFMTTTTTSILSFQKSQETHLSVNSRLDGFMKNAAAAAQAKGVEIGQDIANERTDEIAFKKKVKVLSESE